MNYFKVFERLPTESKFHLLSALTAALTGIIFIFMGYSEIPLQKAIFTFFITLTINLGIIGEIFRFRNNRISSPRK